MATPADTPTPSAAPEPSRKRKAWLLGLVLLLILAGVGAWAWYSLVGRWHESTDDAYVNGNVVEITPLVTGTVTSIGADDGDLVHAGQVLLQFDPADSQVALQAAEARLARSVRQVRGLYSNVDALKAQLETRQAELRKARQDFNRRKVLADSGAIAAEELSHARDDLSVAEAAVNRARQQLSTSSALVDDTVVSSHPEVMAAAADLRQAYLDHARTTLVAPVTGYVAKRTVQLGQRLQPGTATMAVIPLDQVWIDANFKETQLRDMRIGQPVQISADLYGSEVRYSGTVDSLGAGTGSAFARCRRRMPPVTGSRSSSACRYASTSAPTSSRTTRCVSGCPPWSRSTCTTRAARPWPNSHRSRPAISPRCMTASWSKPTT
jgi:membrane fusion protein (multidrug efflux system)